jgi:heptosyltransferase-2
MTTPALLRLRERFPETHITLLTQQKLRDLWDSHPAVDEILTFEKGESLWTVAKRIRQGRFDWALLLPNSPRTGLEAFIARVPRRIGGSWRWRNRLLTDIVSVRDTAGQMKKRTPAQVRALVALADAGGDAPRATYDVAHHQTHHYLRLVAHLGANPTPLRPLLSLSAGEQSKASALYIGAGKPSRWIGLNAGAEYGPAKRWPLENFAAAANELYRREGCGFVVFGGPADVELANRLTGLLSVPAGHKISLAGKTSLRELMISLAGCQVLLTNDTGPMHVAAALGVPVVVPFGSTSPELTGPGLPGDPTHHWVRVSTPCAPCFLRECPVDFRCMKGIVPERVTEAVVAALRARERGL